MCASKAAALQHAVYRQQRFRNPLNWLTCMRSAARAEVMQAKALLTFTVLPDTQVRLHMYRFGVCVHTCRINKFIVPEMIYLSAECVLDHHLERMLDYTLLVDVTQILILCSRIFEHQPCSAIFADVVSAC